MKEQFYIAVNGQQQGPYTIDDLKIKDIQKDTLIWTEGLENWTKAEDIPLIKGILRATPPPLPNTETTSQQVQPPPVPPTISSEKYFGYELARRRERFFAAVTQQTIIFIPLLFIFGTEILDADDVLLLVHYSLK